VPPWDEASLALSDALRKAMNLPVPLWTWRKKKESGAVPVEVIRRTPEGKRK
jgi:hypothetical protein